MSEASTGALLLRDVVCYPDTTPSDVVIREGRVTHVLPPGTRVRAVDRCIEGRGAALLPGLHDHHLHLFALAASRNSVALALARDVESVRRALRAAPGAETDWIRATGYHEVMAGPLDRGRLDALVATRPVRVQHASGKAWFFNSAALDRLGVLDQSAAANPALTASPFPEGLERDAAGMPTGRLFRGDDWLRLRLTTAVAPDLSALSQDLVRLGLTGVTDASADNDNDQANALGSAIEAGALVQRLRLMGGADLSRDRMHERIELGERKLLLDDDALPDMDFLVDAIHAARMMGRGTAWHCVSRAELLYALYALDVAGPSQARDRIEHAGVVPLECLPLLAERSLTVVTQPLFIANRGDRYLDEADPEDHPCLYRLQSLRQAGIGLGLSSDAPYAVPDPWAGMRAAVERRTAGGRLVGIEEALTPEQALAGYLSPLECPGGAPRRIAPAAVSPRPSASAPADARADLCLLDRPWSAARDNLHAGLVRAVIVSGRLHYLRDA